LSEQVLPVTHRDPNLFDAQLVRIAASNSREPAPQLVMHFTALESEISSKCTLEAGKMGIAPAAGVGAEGTKIV
jgi:hypothetical protein